MCAKYIPAAQRAKEQAKDESIVTEKATVSTAQGYEIPDNAKIEVIGERHRPILDGQFDPFDKFKTEPDKYYYRALNTNIRNIRERKAEGFEIIEGSEYGDLILGKIPREEHERRMAKEDRKQQNKVNATNSDFREEAGRMGVKTY